jgi:uncharacterized repeat protein (TIGR02543 family)
LKENSKADIFPEKRDYFMKKVIFSILVMAIFVGCFSPWKGGDQAKITLVLSGGQGRAAFPPSESMYNDFEHTVELSSGSATLTFHAKGGTTIEAVVSVGQWDITVETFLDGEIYAAGSTSADLQPGNDNVISIIMYQAFLVKFDAKGGSAVPDQIVKNGNKVTEPDSQRDGYFIVGWYLDRDCTDGNEWDFENSTVTGNITLYAKWEAVTEVPGADLAAKLDWLNSYAQNNGVYIVTVNKNESIGPQSLDYNGKKVSVTIKSDNTKRNIILNNNGALFYINSGVTLILENITLQGRTNNTGSLVSIYGGELVMHEESVITGNSSTVREQIYGGGVHVYIGTFTMYGGTITGNTAWDGGAVHVSAEGTFTMNGGTISGNTAINSGGGVHVWEGIFNMEGGIISDNTASSEGGGGVLVGVGNFTIKNGEIYGNEASYGGGVFVLNGASFTMSGGKISVNTAGWGGGVDVGNGTVTMIDGEISGNTATQEGGGGVNIDSNATFTMNGGAKISGNEANYGAGVNVYQGIFTMSDDAIISGNRASSSSGGGVNLQSDGIFTMSGGAVSGNTTTVSGGGVNMWGGTFTMNGGEISGNTASDAGGGVCIGGEGSIFTMNGGEISGNTANGDGGGLSLYNGTFHIVNGIINGSNEGDMSNTALSEGAALHSNNSTAQYGTFNGTRWNNNGNLATTEDTIKVVDGVLQMHSISVTITFAQIVDINQPLIVDHVISLIGNDEQKTVTLGVENPSQYSSIEWHIPTVNVNGSGDSFTMNSETYPYNSIGEYYVTLEVWKDGIPYNKTVIVTVVP